MQQGVQGRKGEKSKQWQYAGSRERGDEKQGRQGGRETPAEAEASPGAVTATSSFQQQGSVSSQQSSRHVLTANTSLMAAGHTNQQNTSSC